VTAPSFTVPLVEHARTPFPPDIDITPTSGRYVGFFENRHGEQLVYVHERGSDPVLYHGDYEWQPVTVTTPVIARVGTIATWQVGELIVDEAEALWLAGCLSASGASDANPATAIAMAFAEDAMTALREMPFEQRAEMMREARAEAKMRRAEEKKRGTGPSHEQ
jgi:hypothetical protein